jgi:hypothetical protein
MSVCLYMRIDAGVSMRACDAETFLKQPIIEENNEASEAITYLDEVNNQRIRSQIKCSPCRK